MPDEREEAGFHWKSLFSKVKNHNARDPAPETREEQENPWLALQNKHYKQDTPAALSEHPLEPPASVSQQEKSETSARWLSDNSSLYGFSDDDGTLKQLDNQNWRRAFGGSEGKRFVPGQTGNARWQSKRKSLGKPGILSGSTWLMQTVAAVVLVAGGLYVHQNSGPLTQQIDNVYHNAFSEDYSSQMVPAVETFLEDHHVNLPVEWNPTSAMRFHAPLSGQVLHDYSSSHPEMTIQGTSNEAVLSAGSGTVARITSTDKGAIVLINHGTVGESVYTGVYRLSVKNGQYVSSGQVIGHLAKTSSPQLEFGFERNGSFVNPHDYIHFSTGDA